MSLTGSCRRFVLHMMILGGIDPLRNGASCAVIRPLDILSFGKINVIPWDAYYFLEK